MSRETSPQFLTPLLHNLYPFSSWAKFSTLVDVDWKLKCNLLYKFLLPRLYWIWKVLRITLQNGLWWVLFGKYILRLITRVTINFREVSLEDDTIELNFKVEVYINKYQNSLDFLLLKSPLSMCKHVCLFMKKRGKDFLVIKNRNFRCLLGSSQMIIPRLIPKWLHKAEFEEFF